MLYTVVVILAVLWLIGLFAHWVSWLVGLLFIAAAAVLVYRVYTGKRL